MLRPLVIYAVAFITSVLIPPAAEAAFSAASGLTLEVTAGHFVAAAQSSCVDLVESKELKTPARTSVEPQGFLIEGLTLNWDSADILNDDGIRAVVSDANGNRAVLELPPEEILVLMAGHGSSVQGPQKVITNDPARVNDPKFVPCGLAYGGINWLNPAEELKVVLSVIGSVEASNGDLSPLEVSLETSVKP